jgi:L,D-transpeptidase YcbB
MAFNRITTLFFVTIVLLWANGCQQQKDATDTDTVVAAADMDEAAATTTRQLLARPGGKIDDSSKLLNSYLVNYFYANREYQNIWHKEQQWLPQADAAFALLKNAALYGLFSNHYQYPKIKRLRERLAADSLLRAHPAQWSRADILLTDAFFQLARHLKYGRLSAANNSQYTDSTAKGKVLLAFMNQLADKDNFTESIASLEPRHSGYHALKSCLPNFLDSMDKKVYTYVPYPFKKGDSTDSVKFIATLQQRLYESKAIAFTKPKPDSAQLSMAIKKFQTIKQLKADGKISKALIKLMNTSDAERYKRIAINMDRYKMLPDTLPEKYIWVNLPAYQLQVWEADTVVMESKVICGKPETPTPVLRSHITDMVTYPTWTVPTSIIAKQYLPKLKNNPYYLNRLGLRLLSHKGEHVDAGNVNWAKYNKGIPYKVMQNSGDNNALGVIKFNFDNAFAVYLHDTNQRYLFKNAARALSHGCVRVQQWEQLAHYLLRNDSLNLAAGDTLRCNTDSLTNWLAIKKNKRIPVKNKVALYINYLSCQAVDGKLKFYDDMYGEDKLLREKFFNEN